MEQGEGTPDMALAAVETAAWRWSALRPADDPAAALRALAGPGAVPARVLVRVHPPAAALAAAVADGVPAPEALARWCADAAALEAAVAELSLRTAVEVEPAAAPPADPLAALLGALLAATDPAPRLAAALGLPAAAPPDGDAVAAAALLWSARRAPAVVPAADPDTGARIAALEAERDLLADALAEVQAGLAALLFDAAPRRDRIDIAAPGPGFPAFHAREEADGRAFRWLGRAPVATFETLVSRRCPVRATLFVEIEIEPGAAERLELSLDGDAPDAVAFVPGAGGGAAGGRLQATFAARAGADAAGRARLAVRAPARRSPQPGDARSLSVGLSAILLEEVRRPPDDAVERLEATLHGPARLAPDRPLVVAAALPAGRAVRIGVDLAAPASPGALTLTLNGTPVEVFCAGLRAEATAVPPGGPAQLVFAAAGPPLDIGRIAVADAVPRPPPPPVPQRLGADRDGFVQAAFYGLERTAAGVPFRWLGRADEATLSVDGVSGRTVRVEAHLAHAISEAALDGFVFGFDRRFADAFAVRRDGEAIVKSAVLEAGPAPGAGVETGWNRPLRLSLRARVKEDLSARGDPRTLAVAIAKIVVIPL